MSKFKIGDRVIINTEVWKERHGEVTSEHLPNTESTYYRIQIELPELLQDGVSALVEPRDMCFENPLVELSRAGGEA